GVPRRLSLQPVQPAGRRARGRGRGPRDSRGVRDARGRRPDLRPEQQEEGPVVSLEPTSLGRSKALIRQTPLSLVFGFAAASELVFSSTFGGALSYDVVIALALMLTGTIFGLAFQFFKTDFKAETLPRLQNLGLWTLFLLFVFVGTSVLVPQIQR